jgi:hypothetical protein
MGKRLVSLDEHRGTNNVGVKDDSEFSTLMLFHCGFRWRWATPLILLPDWEVGDKTYESQTGKTFESRMLYWYGNGKVLDSDIVQCTNPIRPRS